MSKIEILELLIVTHPKSPIHLTKSDMCGSSQKEVFTYTRERWLDKAKSDNFGLEIVKVLPGES